MAWSSIAVRRSRAQAAEELARQDERRCRGAPVVSVLVGPFGAATAAWRDVAGKCQRSWRLARWSEECSLWSAVAAALEEHPGLRGFAVACLANALGEKIETLASRCAGMSAAQLRLLRERCAMVLPHDVVEMCLVELQTVVDESRPKHAPQRDIDSFWASMSIMAPYMPDAAWPAVLACNGGADCGALPARFAEHSAEIAMATPRLPLGVAITEKQYVDWLANAPESFAKAMLRESAIIFATADADEIYKAVQRRVGAEVHVSPETIEAVARSGATPELVEQYAKAVNAKTCDSPDAARSEAERFLFGLIDGTPELAGLFEQNGELDIRFGTQPMEVDLLCRELRVAIEVDGYHHFGDLDHYRRDRRKDRLLQKHGYVVLRFAAEEVVSAMSDLLQTIREFVRWRRTTPPSSTGSTP